MNSEKSEDITSTQSMDKISSSAEDDSTKESPEIGEVTIATIQANQAYDEILAKRTKALLNSEDDEEEEDDDPLEFVAKTAVFELTDDIRNQLLGEEQTEESKPSGEMDPEMVDKIKKKVKAHYMKKARMVELEIGKILSGFKTTNPKIIKRLRLIKNLLAKHSGSYKKNS